MQRGDSGRVGSGDGADDGSHSIGSGGGRGRRGGRGGRGRGARDEAQSAPSERAPPVVTLRAGQVHPGTVLEVSRRGLAVEVAVAGQTALGHVPGMHVNARLGRVFRAGDAVEVQRVGGGFARGPVELCLTAAYVRPLLILGVCILLYCTLLL